MVPQTQERNGQPLPPHFLTLLSPFSLVFGSPDRPWVHHPTLIRFMPSHTPEHSPHNNLKIATNYIENYTFVFHDTMICRKYAILSTLTQTPNNQHITFLALHFTLHFSPHALRYMPFRNAIASLSSHETCLQATPLAIFRNSIHA